MTNPHRAEYLFRINKVIDHIDSHLSDALPLETLAAIAHFSPYHFHRLFLAMTGETLGDCIRRRRLEVAATLLTTQPHRSILSIAFDVGFESAEVFARNFRKHFGCSASAWRRGAWRETSAKHMGELGKIRQVERKPDQASGALADDNVGMTNAARDVSLDRLPAYRVAYLRQVGPYTKDGSAVWKRLWQWSERHDVRPLDGVAFGIPQDNPHVTDPSKCRYDAGMAVADDFVPVGGINVQAIPGGRYARSDFVGTPEEIMEAWTALFAQWLPDSGYVLDERPVFEMYDVSRPDDAGPGRFRCKLCLPIAPL